MEIAIAIEIEAARKRVIQQHLTALLPEWFGLAEANRHYARQAEVLAGYVARIGGEPKGMLLLKICGPISAEIYWMGVDPSWHRFGIGRALVTAACDSARANGGKFLFVVTLHPNDPYEPYQRTRRFYEAMGFHYVLEEQFYVLEEQFPRERNRFGYYMKEIG